MIFASDEICVFIHLFFQVINLLSSCLSLYLFFQNIVQFSNKYFIQQCGTAMGTPPAPTYATIYFSKEMRNYLVMKFVSIVRFAQSSQLPLNNSRLVSVPQLSEMVT